PARGRGGGWGLSCWLSVNRNPHVVRGGGGGTFRPCWRSLGKPHVRAEGRWDLSTIAVMAERSQVAAARRWDLSTIDPMAERSHVFPAGGFGLSSVLAGLERYGPRRRFERDATRQPA